MQKSILLFIVSGLAFTLMGIPVRFLGDEMPSLEKAFFRNLFGFMCTLMIIFATQGRPNTFKPNAPIWLIMVSILGVFAMAASFYAIDHAELSTVTAISFLRPILATIAAIFFFKEVVKIRRWIAMMVGFFGVFIITDFTYQFDLGTSAALLAVTFSAMVAICMKKLAETDIVAVTVFWMGVIMTPISFVMIFIFDSWVWPSVGDWILLLSIGILAVSAQFCLIASMRSSELSLLLPYDFLKLVWAVTIGFVLFSEPVRFNVILGAILILGATIYMSILEQRSRNLSQES